MTARRFELRILLLIWSLRFLDNCDGGDVEAFARAIMELGRGEGAGAE